MAAIGAIIGGVASFMQLSYQSAIAKANAAQERENAKAVLRQAQEDVQDTGLQRQGEIGVLRAAQGASGVSIASPSFAQGEGQIVDRTAVEVNRLQLAGNQRWAYFETKANIEDTRAKAMKIGAGFALASGFANAAGSMVGGGSSLVSGAAQSPMSPDYIPIPQRRPVLVG